MPSLDLDTTPSEHPICCKLVQVPTINQQRRGFGYPARQPPADGPQQLVLQWFGETWEGNLNHLQFAFPLLADPQADYWCGHPEWFRVVSIAPLRDWPNKDVLAQMMQAGCNLDGMFVYLITSQIGRDDGRGRTFPSAQLVEIICLADSSHGIIRPRGYDNQAVVQEEIAAYNTKRY